jgi:DNA invertase Pin-like site-specific DNA recombinase
MVCSIIHSRIYVPHIDRRDELWDNDTTMLIGYARVSTHEQTLDLQKDALEKAGCDRIYTDTASGAATERPGLTEAYSHLRTGDTLVVWRLDRLGRSLRHLIETLTTLADQGIGFKSITENIDTTTSGGKLVFHIFGSLAEFERDLIRERTHAGLAAARARGRRGGRPKSALANPKKLALAQELYDQKKHTVAEICKNLGIPRTTFYRYVETKPTTTEGG